MHNLSVLGEEDPGAAADLIRSGSDTSPMPAPQVQAEFANPESPSAAAAQAHTLPPAQVSSIQAVARARLLTVGVDAKLAEVAALMSGAQLSLVVVCDASGAVVGVIADTLLIQQFGMGHAGIFATRAGDVMLQQFTACGPADSLPDVLALMHNHGFVHMPVVDGDKRPQGVVYARDGLRALLAAGNYEEAQLRDYVMGVGYR
jgi:CBS domain-containing protein